MQLTIQGWLEDKPGALMRVAGILAAKGCNIMSLTVAPDPWNGGLSRMIIIADVEERLHVRVINEMNRLVNVLLAMNVKDCMRAMRPGERRFAKCVRRAC